MNGLSDVRLSLHARELEQEQRAPVALASTPQGNRWSRFWMRLRTRRQLLALDEHALRDIGLTRAEALEEGLKPFWKV
ncbi:DUF1127 domain-containing protein [Pseudomonas sp. TCU-HL1]|uniref:DUF1127 domain-containing protein n=1 Tax=Pseudomonas sp. TCU-HL1 TaxID=1856685 RepID=UPI00083E1A43|nr:DUF1127 domain-containing protein [Pseudomonas sp. TCU-HL1]AOE82879.1 hypothetical protein THL1_331 [Pseudomonas sp. TCU-HL1]